MSSQHELEQVDEQLTDDSLTDLLERLGPRAGYRLRHVAPPESKDDIEQVDKVTAELLRVLYACVLDPRWSDRFVPPSGMGSSGGDDVMVDAGQERTVTVGPDFTLKGKQEDSGEPEYSESRRGRPCGHVFGNGEGVWHCLCVASVLPE